MFNPESYNYIYCNTQTNSVSSDAVVTKTEEDKEKVVWTVKLPPDSKWWQLDMESDHLVSKIHVVSGKTTNGWLGSFCMVGYVGRALD